VGGGGGGGGVKRVTVMLTPHLHLVQRLRMSGNTPLLPPTRFEGASGDFSVSWVSARGGRNLTVLASMCRRTTRSLKIP